ncbi:hypothetical protein GFL82_23945 [Rhizobium laguerreae]|nr:hypothetical protein [Rhizobium laguerreae]
MQAAQEEDCSATGTIAALAVFALGFANLLAKAVLAASMASIAMRFVSRSWRCRTFAGIAGLLLA